MYGQINPSAKEAKTEDEKSVVDTTKIEDSSGKIQSKQNKVDTLETRIGLCVEEDEDKTDSRASKPRHEEETKKCSSFTYYMKEHQHRELNWRENKEVMITMERPRKLTTQKLDPKRFTVIFLLENFYFSSVLCDSGVSCNVISYFVCKNL